MTKDGITKGERDELRRVVRGDFKALAMEVEVRRSELMAEIEKRVAQRFMAHEEKIAEAKKDVAGIIDAANAGIGAALESAQQSCDGYKLEWNPLASPHMWFVREKRDEMRRAMIADLDARVSHARARMGRQENDLLKKLATSALESEEARAFLAEIPKVAELVPASRLAELEASFDVDSA